MLGGVTMNILNQLLALIGKIPATFWGVVIGSFFSLGGIVIANRANDRRLREQLRHDREMRNRDRELSLRKDVYLSAAEAVSTGITGISRFANLEIADNKLTEAYIDKSPAIAKVHVIANKRTAESLTNLLGELGAAYLRLLAKRIPLVGLRNQILFHQQQVNSFSQERDHMVELMKQFALDGTTDKHRWEVIDGNFRLQQNRIAEASKQIATLSAELSVKVLQLAKECIDETNRMSRLTVPVIASARAELEMPIDEQAYAEIVEQSIKKQEANMRAFMENIRSVSTVQQGGAPDGQEPTAR
jgi:hypothetical protein